MFSKYLSQLLHSLFQICHIENAPTPWPWSVRAEKGYVTSTHVILGNGSKTPVQLTISHQLHKKVTKEGSTVIYMTFNLFYWIFSCNKTSKKERKRTSYHNIMHNIIVIVRFPFFFFLPRCSTFLLYLLFYDIGTIGTKGLGNYGCSREADAMSELLFFRQF